MDIIVILPEAKACYHLDTAVTFRSYGHVWFLFGLLWHMFIKSQHIERFLYCQLVDIILISLEIVRPTDGTHYITAYYAVVVEIIRSGNETYRIPKHNWVVC
ncbi:hypothetical protein GQX74_014129 [Glossina fuscipes]|nr:hypothetical protein GQX74_014129 [Glossina fuscipes]